MLGGGPIALARRVSSLVADLDKIEAQETTEHEAVRKRYAAQKASIEREISQLMGSASSVNDRMTVQERRGKPKKMWKKVAVYIQRNPAAQYTDLGRFIYGVEPDDQKLKNLRALLYQMKKAGAATGDPGSWKLAKTPDEIEWFKSEEGKV